MLCNIFCVRLRWTWVLLLWIQCLMWIYSYSLFCCWAVHFLPSHAYVIYPLLKMQHHCLHLLSSAIYFSLLFIQYLQIHYRISTNSYLLREKLEKWRSLPSHKASCQRKELEVLSNALDVLSQVSWKSNTYSVFFKKSVFHKTNCPWTIAESLRLTLPPCEHLSC